MDLSESYSIFYYMGPVRKFAKNCLQVVHLSSLHAETPLIIMVNFFFFFFFFFFYQYQIIKTQKWLHPIVPSKAGIDTRSSGPHFGRHLQFYYLINQQKSRIQGSFVPNNTKKPKKW